MGRSIPGPLWSYVSQKTQKTPTQNASFSKRHNIKHDTSYPYHPQGNPAETFTKPLGKAMKAAFHEGCDRVALQELLYFVYTRANFSAFIFLFLRSSDVLRF